MNAGQIHMCLMLGKVMDAADSLMGEFGEGEWTACVTCDGSGYAMVEVRSETIQNGHNGYDRVGAHVFGHFENEFNGWELERLRKVDGYEVMEGYGE